MGAKLDGGISYKKLKQKLKAAGIITNNKDIEPDDDEG